MAKCKCSTDLSGKVALVTGGNSGIGLETARELANRGARVVIASRNMERSLEAVTDIKKSTGKENIECLQLDLSKFSSVRQFAAEFNQKFSRLDILVNNAGYLGSEKRPTEDGFNMMMQVNYLGPFLLTNLLLDKLKESLPSRIVVVSSIIYKYSSFNPEDMNKVDGGFFTTYADSKLCQILWIQALSKRLPQGVTINALHPGCVQTNILYIPRFIKPLLKVTIGRFVKTPEEGAQTTIHLCLDPKLTDVTAQYFENLNICAIAKKARKDDFVEHVWNKSNLLTEELR